MSEQNFHALLLEIPSLKGRIPSQVCSCFYIVRCLTTEISKIFLCVTELFPQAIIEDKKCISVVRLLPSVHTCVHDIWYHLFTPIYSCLSCVHRPTFVIPVVIEGLPCYPVLPRVGGSCALVGRGQLLW